MIDSFKAAKRLSLDSQYLTFLRFKGVTTTGKFCPTNYLSQIQAALVNTTTGELPSKVYLCKQFNDLIQKGFIRVECDHTGKVIAYQLQSYNHVWQHVLNIKSSKYLGKKISTIIVDNIPTKQELLTLIFSKEIVYKFKYKSPTESTKPQDEEYLEYKKQVRVFRNNLDSQHKPVKNTWIKSTPDQISFTISTSRLAKMFGFSSSKAGFLIKDCLIKAGIVKQHNHFEKLTPKQVEKVMEYACMHLFPGKEYALTLEYLANPKLFQELAITNQDPFLIERCEAFLLTAVELEILLSFKRGDFHSPALNTWIRNLQEEGFNYEKSDCEKPCCVVYRKDGFYKVLSNSYTIDSNFLTSARFSPKTLSFISSTSLKEASNENNSSLTAAKKLL